MNNGKNLKRVLGVLAKHGLQVSKEGPVYSVSHRDRQDVGPARVLLPEGFDLDKKALLQLCGFAGVSHPDGGRVCVACATPDFHAGSLVPVGSVIATTLDLVIPQAIGTDIQCGMRMHVVDISIDDFMSKKNQWVSEFLKFRKDGPQLKVRTRLGIVSLLRRHRLRSSVHPVPFK